MTAKGEKGYLLARVNFPMYTVKAISERHVLVAGGGGMAKTGISNTFVIYELVYEKSIDSCKAVRVLHYDTGSRAIMSSAVFTERNHFVLATGGMDGMCLLFKLKYSVNGNGKRYFSETKQNQAEVKEVRETRRESIEGLRRRRLSSNSSVKDDKENDANKINQNSSAKGGLPKKEESDDDFPNIGFSITEMESFQTDFNNREGEEPFVKVMRFSVAKNLLVTGGADGHIRCWKYPEIQMTLDIAAHSDEVDDIDIDPQGNSIVSVSRDGHGYLWNAKVGKKVCELEYVLPITKNSVKPVKYNFRSVRYGVLEGDLNNLKIFTILNPVVRQKPPNPSYLCKWDTKKYLTEKIISVGPEVLTAMTVSDDGRFLGVGSLSGTIYVYISYSLQQLYRMPRAHNIFVTGVEFLKATRETQNLTGDKDASLISISVDNHIVVHHIPKQASLGFLGSSVMFSLTLLLIYILLDLLGL